jgi:hypothetical protein
MATPGRSSQAMVTPMAGTASNQFMSVATSYLRLDPQHRARRF